MVIVFVSIGSDNKSRNVVIRMDYINRGNLCIVILGLCMLKIVVIKLIEFKMDEILDRWRLKIVKLIVFLEWLVILFKGG